MRLAPGDLDKSGQASTDLRNSPIASGWRLQQHSSKLLPSVCPFVHLPFLQLPLPLSHSWILGLSPCNDICPRHG